MEQKKDLIRAINNGNKRKIKELTDDISTTLVNSYFGDTDGLLLNIAIENNDIETTGILLEKGANPDGKTDEGYYKHIPFTLIKRTNKDYPKFADLLLAYGADINLAGPDGDNALSKLVLYSSYPSKTTKDNILYLLKRGANPNYPRGKLPLNIVTGHINRSKNKEVADMLFFFGANPNGMYIDPFYNYLTKPLEEVVDKCENSILLEKIARAMQIPVKSVKKKADRDKLCNCIKLIRDNRKNINFDKIAEVREELRKRRGVTCQNEYNLLWTDNIHSYADQDLYFFNDVGKTFCFHVSEIPSILESRKNPYNNNPIEQEKLNDMLAHLSTYPYSTIEEGIDLLEDAPGPLESTYEQDKLKQLEQLVKSYNTYSSISNVQELPTSAYIRLIKRLQAFDYGLPYNQDFQLEGRSKDVFRKEMLVKVLDYSIEAIKNKGIVKVEQKIAFIFDAYNQIELLEKIVGKEDLNNIIDLLIDSYRYNDLKPVLGDENFDKLDQIITANLDDKTIMMDKNEYWKNHLKQALIDYDQGNKDGIN